MENVLRAFRKVKKATTDCFPAVYYLTDLSHPLFFTVPTEIEGRQSPETLLWGFLLQIRLF